MLEFENAKATLDESISSELLFGNNGLEDDESEEYSDSSSNLIGGMDLEKIEPDIGEV